MTMTGERTSKLFIGGAWVDGTGSEELVVDNPATEEVVGRVPQASSKDVEIAIGEARRAFDEGPWPQMKPVERSKILHAFADLIAARKAELMQLLIEEAGSTAMLADFLQVQTPLDHMYWWAERAATFPFEEPLPASTGMGLGQGVVRKEPAGVVAAITPFNFPLFLNLWKLGPALATGNTVVLKPSPYTPFSAFVLGDLLNEAGVPPGVVNIVTGDIAAGETLTTHPDVDMVSFTGSDLVGRKILSQASDSLKKVILELGGKSANIICRGVNLDQVIMSAAMGFTVHCGQGCALTTRILVDQSIHDEVVERLKMFLQFFPVGNPADPSIMMGPLISAAQRERVERYVAIGKEEGAEVAYGGGRPAGLDKGYYVEPTLFVGVDNKMAIAQEEIFGPVGVVIPFKTEEEAVRLANESRYGLGGGVWHPDSARAYEMAKQLRTGLVVVNGGGGGTISPLGTFGGYKHSGIGRELGDHGMHEYVELKTINWGVR